MILKKAKEMDSPIAAYTCICQDDACWIDQYLREATRLGMPFAMHFDKCTIDIMEKVTKHPLCMGYTSLDRTSTNMRVDFDEMHKQKPFDTVVRAEFKWALAWDIDETYERDAPAKIKKICELDTKHVVVRWLNLWETPDQIRVDAHWGCAYRDKFFNLQNSVWRFTHKVINGPKQWDTIAGKPFDIDGDTDVYVKLMDFVCLHWGLMTDELRRQHKARWDYLYTKAVGANPYGVWNAALDTTNLKVEKNEYL